MYYPILQYFFYLINNLFIVQIGKERDLSIRLTLMVRKLDELDFRSLSKNKIESLWKWKATYERQKIYRKININERSSSSQSRHVRFILNYKGFHLSFYIVFKYSSLTWTYRLHVDYQDNASDLQPTSFDFRDITLRLILSFETINVFNLCQIYLYQRETSELDKMSYITAWNNQRYLNTLKIYKTIFGFNYVDICRNIT